MALHFMGKITTYRVTRKYEDSQRYLDRLITNKHLLGQKKVLLAAMETLHQ